MLEVYFRKADIACMTQIAVGIRLRKRPLHIRPPGIVLPELRCLLASARRLDRLVLLARSNSQASGAFFCLGTLAVPRTGPTVLWPKPDHHRGVPAGILFLAPRATHLAFRADRLLHLPVKTKLRVCDSIRSMRLSKLGRC
jgi:hypothetical protein